MGGAKSDILRYEIVYRHGGIYLDTDTVSVEPIGEGLSHSFVAGINPGWKNIQNSIFGFPKGSKFLEYALKMLRKNLAEKAGDSVPYRTGPPFFCGCFVNYNDPLINIVAQSNLVLKSNSSILYQTMDAT